MPAASVPVATPGLAVPGCPRVDHHSSRAREAWQLQDACADQHCKPLHGEFAMVMGRLLLAADD